MKLRMFLRLGFFAFFDILLSFLSFFSAYLLRFNFEIPEQFFYGLWRYFLAFSALKIICFYSVGLYKIPWRFFSLDGLKKLVLSHILAYGIFVGFLASNFWLNFAVLPIFPKSIPFIDGAISMILIGMFRISRRFFSDAQIFREKSENIAIFGANENGERQFRSLDRVKYRVRFFIETDLARINLKIHNLPVIAPENIAKFAEKYGVNTAIVAIEDNTQIKKIYELLHSAGIKNIKIARSAMDDYEAQPLKIEDLLARNPKDLDKNLITNFVKNNKVLITGAGGSIGSELARMAQKYGAKELILLDSGEYNLYAIGEELPNAKLKMINVVDRDKIFALFLDEKPDIIIHAAAYKHVPLVELNMQSAIVNNILGTKNCIDAALNSRAKSFVLISSDKAVRPTSVMGATKRVCELYLQNVSRDQPQHARTRLLAVRFGNVLGSSGSVVPKFRKLIEENRPLTVTHPEITRYFMLTSEAAELVLQSGALAEGGEVFVLDMGKPVKIADLAQKMLDLSGKPELGVVFTGLRAGEKLYEELLLDTGEKATKYPSIFVGKRVDYDFALLERQIAALSDAADIPAALKEIVPEFNHNKNGDLK
ncbi:MAG: polysaccharide biosynthesis protein [Helicobacteraceae bacterium]|jgi:UDP-N-acetyl-D-glucosamine 4,6-dehydratase|nr:polysaccharide biosynthesis protein [Helicobacteraceae bacterium]